MPDEDGHIHMEPQSNAGKWILVVVGILAIAVFGYAHYATYSSIGKLKQDLSASQAQVKELQNRMQSAEETEDALRQQSGLTKQELAQKTAELRAAQKASEARLEKEQKAGISQVSGDIAGVKTDVGGVKTDLGNTKADLEATKASLQSVKGDMGVQSGLIATTRDDLEVLKHRGDRNYFEFTLLKGAAPQMVSTVSVQLKKTDPKKGKFTLNVTADDKTIEKKDRSIAEPIQFYSTRAGEHMLFELVIWSVDKNKATGYLSTPKGAPTPVTASAPTSGAN